jgi:hypothetical protein
MSKCETCGIESVCDGDATGPALCTKCWSPEGSYTAIALRSKDGRWWPERLTNEIVVAIFEKD